RALEASDMEAVTRIQLKRLEAQLAHRRIALDASDEAIAWLAQEGADAQLGARPLKRLIQQAVVNPLSRLVLEGRLHPGGLARLRVVDGEISVEADTVQ
ncbi:MAG: type VI secretion system ATPase TssH, partial [Acidobacteria bacterium]|nr:type VI secretion system ATPase TssH [Acidobacteriota bacterium]